MLCNTHTHTGGLAHPPIKPHLYAEVLLLIVGRLFGILAQVFHASDHLAQPAREVRLTCCARFGCGSNHAMESSSWWWSKQGATRGHVCWLRLYLNRICMCLQTQMICSFQPLSRASSLNHQLHNKVTRIRVLQMWRTSPGMLLLSACLLAAFFGAIAARVGMCESLEHEDGTQSCRTRSRIHVVHTEANKTFRFRFQISYFLDRNLKILKFLNNNLRI